MTKESSSPLQPPQDDGIIFRRYQPQDHDAIRQIFRQGMQSNVVSGWRSICSAPTVATIMISLGSLVGVSTWSILARQNGSSQRAVVMGLGASVLTVKGLMATIWHKISNGLFADYIKQSLNEDLSSPEELLKVYGGNGAFVVAVDQTTNKVVGMVAGQEIEKEHDKPTPGLFELRRMSVDKRSQNRGIGKRLIHQLELELPRDKQHIKLGCSNIQYAAHRLYEQAGFRLRQRIPFPSDWLLGQGIHFLLYEKDFRETTNGK